MKQKIQDLLSYYQLSAAEFSKIIGVNPSGLSHIIGGKRNHLSIDTIVKIKRIYTEVSLDWLILGEGEMISGSSSPGHLFDTNFDSKDVISDKFEGSENLIIEEKSIKAHEFDEEIDRPKDKKIKKIVVFNSDNTFEEYFSKVD